MLDRRHIEKFLHLNGLDSHSPEEQIRTLLLSARWHESDVDAVLITLRDDPNRRIQRVDTWHKVFNTDSKLNPNTLSSLLGMDVEIHNVVNEHKQELETQYKSQLISILLLSIGVAIVFLFILMWFMKVGIFHELALEF